MKINKLKIRVAIRKEGNWVNAYLAEYDTMEDAKLIGSLAIGIAGRGDFFARWKQLMSDAMALAVEDIYGQKPVMETEPAPEHERAGNA